jgi:GxxExxY protein
MNNKTIKKSYPPIPMEVEQIGKAVLDAAYKVHTTFGPGLLETVYETALAFELRKRGFKVDSQMNVPIVYEGEILASGLRLDLIVENCVIVELKAVEEIKPLYEAQLMTYLRLCQVRLGYLMNFNVEHLKDGIKRIVC